MMTSDKAPSPFEDAMPPALSVVIPFYNEESCVEQLLGEVSRAMDGIGSTCEIVVVDDGSIDATASLLAEATREDSRVRVLGWRRNRGQAAALLHGLHAARAPILVTMDGDGQNDPADIARLLEGLDEADMVIGIRAQRRDSPLRRWMSRLANGLRGRILGDHVRDSGCALKVFRREVVDAFLPIRTLYSFMPALAAAAGFRLAEMDVHHRPRRGGTSSYGLRQFLWRPFVDMLGIWWFIRRRVSIDSELLTSSRWQRGALPTQHKAAHRSLPEGLKVR